MTTGALVWFNEQKAVGLIVADDGERLAVTGADFANGAAPIGRCGGTRVSFDVAPGTHGRTAVHVSTIVLEPQARARRRRGGY
jgi:cold shock CspA family protein